MNLVEQVRALAGRRLSDEDGNEYVLTPLPPLSAAEFTKLEAAIPCALPDAIRDLLRFTRGFENGPLELADISGLSGGYDDPEIFPSAVPIAHDGCGNYWVVDLTPGSTTWGPIFFACHDPPVIAYQCSHLGEFLEAFIALAQPPFGGPLRSIPETAVMTIWKTNPQAKTRSVALAEGDEELRDFAQTLDDTWIIVDLRKAAPGDGFSWGRFGPKTAIRRAGHKLIFAYQKKTFLQRVLGK